MSSSPRARPLRVVVQHSTYAILHWLLCQDEATKLSQRIEERHERELKELGVREAAEAAAASPSGAAAAAAKQDALAASASKYVKNLAVDAEDGEGEGGEGQQVRACDSFVISYSTFMCRAHALCMIRTMRHRSLCALHTICCVHAIHSQ